TWSGVSVLMIFLLVLVCRGGDEWQFHSETAALAGGAAGFNSPVVGRADRLHNGQAQAGPALLARTRFIDPEKPIEYARQGLGWDADAIVCHFEDGLAVLGRDLQSYRPA